MAGYGLPAGGFGMLSVDAQVGPAQKGLKRHKKLKAREDQQQA